MSATDLTNSDIAELMAFRRQLHRRPELSGEEKETAKAVVAFLSATQPDKVVEGLGGTGVAVVYEGADPGPTVMLRAELDGLPIEELSGVEHSSEISGKGHLCGHDGHSTILCAVGRMLGRKRPKRGRAVLLFQPAEETGQGAAAVLDDSDFDALRPDFAFSLHNLPGVALRETALAVGPANCASRGMRVQLTGRTAHASMPETGDSPMPALARLMQDLPGLGTGGALDLGYRLVTLTHVCSGEEAFGIAPGKGVLLATLRTLQDADMGALCAEAEALVQVAASEAGVAARISYHDVFHACKNDEEATEILLRAMEVAGVECDQGMGPMRWSEDFGRFAEVSKSAMFILGSGETHPQLHNPDYDFPDDLIPVGAAVFHAAIKEVLG